MKQLFGGEIRLQVGNQKQHPGIVQGWQFVMQLRVDQIELSFYLVELFFGFNDFRLILLLARGPAVIDQLVAVSLAVVVHQFPVAFVDFFLLHGICFKIT